MITPGDEIPLDDAEDADQADQQSQQDIHSNGFDEEDESPNEDDDSSLDAGQLDQAYEASEPAYTLDEDDDE